MKDQKTATPSHMVCQKWKEVELGWGERPDGFSLHVSEEDRQQFIKQRIPNPRLDKDYIIDTDGEPYLVPIDKLDQGQVQRVLASEFGARFDGPAPAGGKDGWQSVGPGMYGKKEYF